MRQCKHWLNSYLEYTQRQESPELFHLWTAISVLGMTLGRKCYFDKGIVGVCYPNQYIILVSGTAKCAKTTAAKIGIKLFKAAEIGTVMQDKVTTRVLSQELNQNQVTFGSSSLYIFSSELDTLFGADSYQSGLFALLTDLYECWDEKKYRTATQGVDVYKDVFINILGCTIPAWLENAEYLTEGGFAGRIIFVSADKPRAANPLPIPSPKERYLYNALITDLKEIAKLTGPFTFTSEAQDYYAQWYSYNHNKVSIDGRLDGYFNRKRDHVLKLAMIINAAKNDTKIINQEDVEQALEYLTEIEKTLTKAFVGVSYSKETKFFDKLINYIKDAGGTIEHSKLLKKMTHYTPAKQFKELIETAMESETIKMVVTKGGKREYKLK